MIKVLTKDEVIQFIINRGDNPNDFKITSTDDMLKIEPQPSFEQRQVARQEDKPIKEDVDLVAEIALINAMDKDDITQLLMYALEKIDELEAKING